MSRPMLPLAEALAAYGKTLQPLPAETVPLTAALNRVLREPLQARCDLPRHSQSALDGYVLRDDDAAAAPIQLKIAGQIAAGDTTDLKPLAKGEAQRILTGARVPPGAVCVVAQERTERRGDEVYISKTLSAGANVRWQGEEMKQGAELMAAGLRLNAGHLAAAAMAGYAQLLVSRTPQIAVLVTGDELREPGSPLAPGQIWDSNGPLAGSWLRAQGYQPQITRVPDDEAQVTQILEQALTQNDLVISTGGVSVGDRDFILPVAEKLDVRRVFWEVAQKPGKPLYFGLRGNTSLLGIPGNPAAVLVCLALHARLLLEVMEAVPAAQPDWRNGVLQKPVKSDAQRDRLVRMSIATDSQGMNVLTNLPHQDSHMLSNLVQANALALLPARAQDYAAGECVQWISLP